MNTLRNIALFTLLLACQPFPTAQAALPIDLEVATEPGLPLAAPQQWAQLLGQLDLGSVRLRPAVGGETATLTPLETSLGTRYQLLAVLSRRGELVLPDRRFAAHQRPALQQYFQQLPLQAAHHAQPRGRFGLTEIQFQKLYAELSAPVGFSTLSLSASEVAARLLRSLATPVTRDPVASTANPKLTVELQAVSTGTALAYVLRCEGRALSPEQTPGEPLQLRIVAADSAAEVWPVGWKLGTSSRQVAPQLYQPRTIELSGFTLASALTALAPALRLPVLYDDWILTQAQIDPAKIEVALPGKRTLLKSALGKLASQARLADELRVDELGQPFLWLTRFGKNSPTAVE
jgi:hypothetical protein